MKNKNENIKTIKIKVLKLYKIGNIIMIISTSLLTVFVILIESYINKYSSIEDFYNTRISKYDYANQSALSIRNTKNIIDLLHTDNEELKRRILNVLDQDIKRFKTEEAIQTTIIKDLQELPKLEKWLERKSIVELVNVTRKNIDFLTEQRDKTSKIVINLSRIKIWGVSLLILLQTIGLTLNTKGLIYQIKYDI